MAAGWQHGFAHLVQTFAAGTGCTVQVLYTHYILAPALYITALSSNHGATSHPSVQWHDGLEQAMLGFALARGVTVHVTRTLDRIDGVLVPAALIVTEAQGKSTLSGCAQVFSPERLGSQAQGTSATPRQAATAAPPSVPSAPPLVPSVASSASSSAPSATPPPSSSSAPSAAPAVPAAPWSFAALSTPKAVPEEDGNPQTRASTYTRDDALRTIIVDGGVTRLPPRIRDLVADYSIRTADLGRWILGEAVQFTTISNTNKIGSVASFVRLTEIITEAECRKKLTIPDYILEDLNMIITQRRYVCAWYDDLAAHHKISGGTMAEKSSKHRYFIEKLAKVLVILEGYHAGAWRA